MSAAAGSPGREAQTAAALAPDAIHIHWLERSPSQGRAPLRRVLAAYAGMRPEAIELVQDAPEAKPRFPARPRLGFNWSHSAGLAAVAVGLDLELGIDLEWTHRRVRAMALAERHFATAEFAWLGRQPEPRRDEAFLRLWTGKEAVLKVAGRGVWSIEGVELTVDPSGELALQLASFGSGAQESWQLSTLATPCENLLAALAWRGTAKRIRHFSALEPLAPASLHLPPADFRP